MELHVPVQARKLDSVVYEITNRLDAVVLLTQASSVYTGHVMLTLTGNPRDLAIAAERAAKLGGVVD